MWIYTFLQRYKISTLISSLSFSAHFSLHRRFFQASQRLAIKRDRAGVVVSTPKNPALVRRACLSVPDLATSMHDKMASTAVVNCSGLQVADNCLFLLKSECEFLKSNSCACASVMSDIYDVNRSLCSEFGMILFCKFHPTDPIKLKSSFVHCVGMANVEVRYGKLFL